MLATSEWHPIAVHFPLALVITGAAALTASRLERLRKLRTPLATVGTWNLCLGALGAVLALGTGLASVLSLHLGPQARAAVALHAKWALPTSMGLVLLAMWRGIADAQDARPSRWFLVLVWAAAAALVITGFWGGRNVYQFGIGVQSTHQAPGISPVK